MSSQKTSEFLRVAEEVLAKEKRPLSARAIVEIADKEGLFSDRLSGKTPWQTMKSKLSQHIRRHGEASQFVRTAPGRFTLRGLTRPEGVYHAPPLTKPAGETVVVVPTEIFDQIGRFQGVRKKWQPLVRSLLRANASTAMDRLAAEQLETHKQVLTYILVTRRGKLLGFKRGVYSRVESELRGAHCVGFGGHVAALDYTLFTTNDIGIRESAARELREELSLPPTDGHRLSVGVEGIEVIGVLNDDSSAIGRRHFAIVMRYEVSDDASWDEPRRGEKSITQLRWIDPSEELSLRNFEYWSQLCIRTYFPGVVPEPEYVVRRRSGLVPPHLLVLLGEIGSGKTEAATTLRRSLGYKVVNSGTVVSDLLDLPPVPETPREVFQERAQRFIQESDAPRKLAQAMLDAAGEDADRIVIEGIRQRATLAALKTLSTAKRVGVVYVHTPPDVAYRFFANRETKVPPSEFFARREAEVEKEVVSLIAEADVILYNWRGLARFRKMILQFAHEVGLN